LTGANLEGAGLEGANLEGANLQGANLRGAVLLNALYDATTIWPNGFDASAQGAVRRAWPQEPAPATHEPAPATNEPAPASQEPEEEPPAPPVVGWPHEAQEVEPPNARWPLEPSAPDPGIQPYHGWPETERDEPERPEGPTPGGAG
jgi:hypothetical protein